MKISTVMIAVFMIFIQVMPPPDTVSARNSEPMTQEDSPETLLETLLDKMDPTHEKEMKVHFIDVGQGDSILIETPNGKHVLIDGGEPAAGKKLVNYLEKEGVTTIDLMVATHPDIDHIGGLTRVMKKFDIKKVLDSGKLYTTNTYFHYIKGIKKRDIPVKIASEEEKVNIDPDLSMKVLNAYSMLKTNNQSSIVLRLSYGVVDFLLMADAEAMQEEVLLKEEDLRSEILKVGHHGSATSTTLSFLQEVQPDVSILSYSKDNDYGHPVDSVVENLKKVGTTIYETAKSGDVIITTDGKNYQIDVSYTEKVAS